MIEKHFEGTCSLSCKYKIKFWPMISLLRLAKIKQLVHSVGRLGGHWPQVMGDVYSMLWVVTWPHPSDIRWAHCWCNSSLLDTYSVYSQVCRCIHWKVVYYRKLETTVFISQELSLVQNRKSASLYQRWSIILWMAVELWFITDLMW